MATTSADERTPLVKEDLENSSLDFISQCKLDQLNAFNRGLVTIGAMLQSTSTMETANTADTAKSSIRKGLRFVLLSTLGPLCAFWLWLVFVLLATKKGCPCKGDIRLWLMSFVVVYPLIMCYVLAELLWLNVTGRADEFINEIFSEGGEVRRWESQLHAKLELDTEKTVRRFQCGCLISQCIHWMLHALQYFTSFYGAFCLYRAPDHCCGLLYYTCLIWTVFYFIGFVMLLNNWRTGGNVTRGGG